MLVAEQLDQYSKDKLEMTSELSVTLAKAERGIKGEPNEIFNICVVGFIPYFHPNPEVFNNFIVL